MEIKRRFFQASETSFFLFGPRGTGKSTWLHAHLQDALFVDLLAPETFRLYAARPERLRELIAGNPAKGTVIIDEVQKLPELLDVVHQLIEQHRSLRFVLTGSSARKLKRTGVDLLAGRAVLKTMHPFMAAELGAAFDLECALRFGLVPLVVDSASSAEALGAYAALYLREEVQMEGLVRNVGNFSRFLESISFSHGSVLSVSAVARECQVERKTVEGYIDILEDLLLCFRVPVFSKRAKRHLIAHPKFYFFDVGVFRSLRPAGPLDRPEEIHGSALEGLVAQHLRAWNAYGGEHYTLFFWRTKSGREVDFVLYGSEGFWAIEVKNTRTIRLSDLSSLRAFKQDYPEAEVCLLYRGDERIEIQGIRCLPCGEFLQGLVPGRPLLGHTY